jgi:hypothetical protein
MLELEACALMEKKNDETWYLIFIYVFNSKLLWILFSIYYRNDYGTNMDCLSFDRFDYLFFNSFIVVYNTLVIMTIC